MTFDEALAQVIEFLQRQGRVSYSALKRRFDFDDAYLADLKAELIEAQRLAADEDGHLLVWLNATDKLLAPPLAPQAPAPIDGPDGSADERRQLTVMLCDLVDSTKLSSQLDPEDLREVILAYQATCAEVIQHFDGHIAQYLGDGLLVYFGYPQAHEDDAQRAIRTGLGIVEAIRPLNQRLEQEQAIRLAVRVGIHTGLVVVSAIGGGGQQEYLALGDTPNIAAQIQSLALSNTVVTSAATWHLVQGYFTCRALGPQRLHGVATAVPVYQVLG